MNDSINLSLRMLALSLRGRKPLKEEFEHAAIPHLSYLYTAAFYLTKDEREAEDLVQETYLRAYRFFQKFEPGTNCRAWLLSIQRHLFINRYKRRKREPEFVDWERVEQEYDSLALQHSEARNGDPQNLLSSQLIGPEVQKALKNLPEEFRTAIILVDLEELTYEEAAKVMECPVGTVRSRLSRGRRLLQVALKDYALETALQKK